MMINLGMASKLPNLELVDLPSNMTIVLVFVGTVILSHLQIRNLFVGICETARHFFDFWIHKPQEVLDVMRTKSRANVESGTSHSSMFCAAQFLLFVKVYEHMAIEYVAEPWVSHPTL